MILSKRGKVILSDTEVKQACCLVSQWCPVSSSEAAAVGLSDRLLGFELHFELSSSSSSVRDVTPRQLEREIKMGGG